MARVLAARLVYQGMWELFRIYDQGWEVNDAIIQDI